MKQSTPPVRLTPPALATQVWPGKQDYNLMALYQLGAEIVKVDMHRDTAYSIQSGATVAVYDPNHRQFNIVATLPPPLLRCGALDRLNSAAAQIIEGHFSADVAELLRLAALIIRPQ
jgi:hypothetical protein